MGRFIDAGKAIEVIVDTPSMVGSKYDFDHDVLTALVDREHEIIDLINNNVPTADVAPVIHAHWIRKGGWSTSMDCSNCGLNYEGRQDFTGSTYYSASDFCPKCGAIMDE